MKEGRGQKSWLRPSFRVSSGYRPERVSPRPPSGPLSLRFCLSRSLSASLASFSVCLVLALCAASSPAAPFLCWARPSAFFSSSPVKTPAASFILPLILSSIAPPSLGSVDRCLPLQVPLQE